MSLELAIFDCDGVLVDSEPLANRILAEELAEIGLPLTQAEVCDTFIGLSLPRCLELIAERLGRPAPDGFLDRLQCRTYEAFRERLVAVPGVVEALSRIRVPTCVASSGSPEKMRLTLGLTGLLPRFEGRMFSAREVERGKPHPDLFLHAARCMRAAPERTLVIEDSLPGVTAAIAAGMGVLGFARRTDPAALAAAGARVFREMHELPDLLDGA